MFDLFPDAVSEMALFIKLWLNIALKVGFGEPVTAIKTKMSSPER